MGSVRGMTGPDQNRARAHPCRSGPVRGSVLGPVPRCAQVWLALVLLPSSAMAEVCDKERPDWDGAPASAVSEALMLAGSLPSVVLILATALAIRVRSVWGGLAAVCGWSILVGVLVFGGDRAIRDTAIAEGCVGSPALFIAAVAAICVGTILYTAPNEARSSNQEK